MSKDGKTLAEINDEFRRTCREEEIVLSNGMQKLPKPVRLLVIKAIRDFDSFHEAIFDHDDFSLDCKGQTYFAFIHHFDRQTGNILSNDPTDPDVTIRKMKIICDFEVGL